MSLTLITHNFIIPQTPLFSANASEKFSFKIKIKNLYVYRKMFSKIVSCEFSPMSQKLNL